MFACLFFTGIIAAQVSEPAMTDSACMQKDIKDVINKWRHKAPAPPTGETGSLLLVPVIGTNPATGFMIGTAGQYAFQLPSSSYSSISANLSFTTKKQLLIQVKNNIYMPGNRAFLSGDWRVLIFSQDTYGLSTAAPENGVVKFQYGVNGINVDDDSLVQPLRYTQLRFYQTISFSITRSFYLGFGYHFDAYYNIRDLKLDTAKRTYTSHYIYSQYYQFNPERYTLSGLSLNVLWDTRDNLVNAYKGFYANVNFRVNPRFLGSSSSSTVLDAEWRSFHPLSGKNRRHLLAFWALGNFTAPGKVPYLALPALGYDQRGRSGRGYVQGRFRGTDMLYAESEYRFPISSCGSLFGGVLFVNVTTANDPGNSVRLLDYLQTGYGFGLRLMVDKRSRTNLQLDFGFGNRAGGVYLGASETF